MTEGFMVRPRFKYAALGEPSENGMARPPVVQGLRVDDDKQPGIRLAFTGFACVVKTA
jgi:hypothetical protein